MKMFQKSEYLNEKYISAEVVFEMTGNKQTNKQKRNLRLPREYNISVYSYATELCTIIWLSEEETTEPSCHFSWNYVENWCTKQQAHWFDLTC